MKILGLDCSSSTIGWGLISDSKLVSHGSIKPLKSKFDIVIRLQDVYEKIGDLCIKLEPDQIVIEDFVLFMGGKSSAKTITTLAIFNRTVGLSVYSHTGIIPILLPVGLIRKTIRTEYNKIDPKFKKEDIPDIIRTYLDPNFTNKVNRNNNISNETYDEADAIAVAWAYNIIRKTEK